MKQFIKYGDGRRTVQEMIEHELKLLKEKQQPTLKDVSTIVGQHHVLGGQYRYLRTLGVDLAREFFILESATWHLMGKKETIELGNKEFDSYLSVMEISGVRFGPNNNLLSRLQKPAELAEQLSKAHWKLHDKQDFDGDSLKVELDKTDYMCRKKLMHELTELPILSIKEVKSTNLTFAGKKH